MGILETAKPAIVIWTRDRARATAFQAMGRSKASSSQPIMENDEFSDIENDDLSDRLDEIERRVDDLESESSEASTGLSLGYALGIAIAVVLSWSRKASILWCILHGLLSWACVIYFAATR